MLDKLIAAGFLFAVVFSALAYGAVEPWSVAGLQAIILVLILAWGIKSAKDRRLAIVVPATALPLFAILIVGLVQSFAFTKGDGTRLSLSMDVEASRSAAAVLAFLTLSFLIAANWFGSPARMRTIADFLVVYGFAMAVFALVQHFTWNGRFYWIRPNSVSVSPFGPFANHNHFAGYMEMIVPIPIALVMTQRMSSERRIFYCFAAGIMTIATLASLSRGGVLSLGCGLAFVLLLKIWLRKKSGMLNGGRMANKAATSGKNAVFSVFLPVGVLVVAITVGVFWIGTDPLVHRAKQSQSSGEQSFSATRGWIWRDTLTMIAANPVLGVGMGAYGTAFPIYSRSDGSLRVPESHNDYLQVVADCGIVGGAIAAWFLISLFKALFRGILSDTGADRDSRFLSGLALGLGGGIFAILVHSLVDFNLQIPSNALLFLVLSAVASRLGEAVAEPRNVVVPRPLAVEHAVLAGFHKRISL